MGVTTMRTLLVAPLFYFALSQVDLLIIGAAPQALDEDVAPVAEAGAAFAQELLLPLADLVLIQLMLGRDLVQRFQTFCRFDDHLTLELLGKLRRFCAILTAGF